MWSTGTLILFCILSFVLGEAAVLFVISLFAVNKGDKDNDNKQ